MLEAIEALDGPARAGWGACTWREFNVGYDCGVSGLLIQSWPANLLRRMGEAGVSLGVTLYPPGAVGEPA